MVDFSPSPQIGADITPVRRWGDFSRCRSLVFVPYYQANPFRNYDIPCTGALCSPVRQHPLRRFKHVLEHNKKETDFKGPSVFAAKENSSPRVNAVAAKDEPIKRSTCYPLSNVRNLARRPRRRLPHYSRDEFSPQNIARVSTHSSEAMRLKGSRRLATGDVLQAKRLFEQSVEADPSNGRAWQDLAKAVERSPRGGLRSKLKVLELALRHNSSNPYLWQSLAVLKLRMSKLEEACDHCQQGIQRDSTHASLYVTWATAEEKRCNVATARAIYEKADKLATPSAKLYHSWGRLELRQGSKQRARDLFEKGLSCDSRNHYIWHSLGSIARANGEAGRARYCFSKALESDANNVVVLEERAKLEAHENNYALARAFFSRGATANGTDARILHSWSLFEYQVCTTREV